MLIIPDKVAIRKLVPQGMRPDVLVHPNYLSSLVHFGMGTALS